MIVSAHGLDVEKDLGLTIGMVRMKRGLERCVRGVHFDPGGKLGMWHPRIGEWQGVYVDDNYVVSMDRNDPIPEYNVYATDEKGQPYKVIRVGWRHTMHKLVQQGHATWPRLCKEFRVDYKQFNGEQILEA